MERVKVAERAPNRRYPVKGYLGVLSEALRRDMALRYWFPQVYKSYRLGALRSGSDALYYFKSWLRENVPFFFELLRRVKRILP